MSTPDSRPSAPLSSTPSSPISLAPSQFLLPLTNPSAAAAHNTTLKLQGLLARPELAANVRAELCPNDLTLGELFHVFSWSKTDRLWKGLGYGAKEPALYNLVRLLAPACSLPDSSEVTKNEISAWVKTNQREQVRYFKDLASLERKTQRGSAVEKNSNKIYLEVARKRGAQLLSFKGAQDKLDLQRGKATSTPPPRQGHSVADFAIEPISPAICPALAELTNSLPGPLAAADANRSAPPPAAASSPEPILEVRPTLPPLDSARSARSGSTLLVAIYTRLGILALANSLVAGFWTTQKLETTSRQPVTCFLGQPSTRARQPATLP